MLKTERKDRHRMFFNLLLNSDATDVTDEELVYYREHPDEIEEVTAPLNIHKFFLVVGGLLGGVFVIISKVFKYSGILGFMHEGVSEFVIDIAFEGGVALIGAVITAYLLGILLDKQQENASTWRAEIRRRIKESEETAHIHDKNHRGEP